jgi:hypothetical protein
MSAPRDKGRHGSSIVDGKVDVLLGSIEQYLDKRLKTERKPAA